MSKQKLFTKNQSVGNTLNTENSIFYFEDVFGDENLIKAVSKRNGTKHELFVLTISDDDFERIQKIEEKKVEFKLSVEL